MSDYSDESELLAYESEQDHPVAVLPIDPVPVRVCDPVITVVTVPQHMTTYTVVVAAGTSTAVSQLLPLDLFRVRATILVNDQAVVICHSQTQAQDPSNVVAAVPNPSGAYVPAGANLVITGSQQMWVAATGATPARVTVISERRS